jgi:NAD(P)-dependent dehydrogenase (short-subunit alcohol dehydrogenase family)
MTVPGDLTDPAHCRAVIAKAVEEFGRIDVLVSNAAFQMTHDDLGEISDEEWDYTLALNLSAMFHLCKAALPHMRPGSSIIGSSSVNSDVPTPKLLPYDATKAGIANFTAALAGLLADKGIRANSVAPGPIWTPLIRRPCPPDRSPALASRCRWTAPGSPPKSLPPT